MLALNAEIGDFDKEHKSGSELWRLLVFNYERKSAYNIVNVMGMIRNVEKAKSMADVQPKIATLQRLYIEFAKGFQESQDKDIKERKGALKDMPTMGYFEVFEKADLFKILPDSVMKDLRRSPDIKLEVTSFDDLLNTVQQLVKDSCTTAVPMDLDALKEVSPTVDKEGSGSEATKEDA